MQTSLAESLLGFYAICITELFLDIAMSKSKPLRVCNLSITLDILTYCFSLDMKGKTRCGKTIVQVAIR